MTTPKPVPASTPDDPLGEQARIDERLDRELAETFPASDPPSVISPVSGDRTRTEDDEREDKRDQDAPGPAEKPTA